MPVKGSIDGSIVVENLSRRGVFGTVSFEGTSLIGSIRVVGSCGGCFEEAGFGEGVPREDCFKTGTIDGDLMSSL
jgi:hypothetical protein